MEYLSLKTADQDTEDDVAPLEITTRGSNFDSLSRRFGRLRTRTSTAEASVSASDSSGAGPARGKGPLGLNTLWIPDGGPVNADLIFVHGLGGGSVNTWRADRDPAKFWPGEWLPEDDDFSQDVRIHSFGYSSNWDKQSILSVDDFANALLSSILHCPDMLTKEKVCLP